jgi:hypothetical protein
MNQDRSVSSLLKTQILHLQEAEFRLPADLQTNIYIHAIKTEGEAGEYIRRVTAALHRAHGSQVVRAKPRGKAKRGIAIAAAAEKRPAKKSARVRKARARGKAKGKPKRKT